MFYCDDCCKKKGWPERVAKSNGLCEVCGKVKPCNDVPSADLPAVYYLGDFGFPFPEEE